MLTNWRQILGLICAAAISTAAVASDQGKWPERPVRFIVPFAAGGGVDIASRVVADKLKDRWGQPVIIDNKPGANTLIAAQSVLSSPKDGYTLLVTNAATFYLPAVNPTVKMRPLEDFVSVAELNLEQLVLVASSNVPASKVSEIAALARANPKSYSFGTYGYGTVAHLVLLEINRSSQLEMTHVPFRGTAPVMQALLSGDIALGVSNYATAKPFIDSGKLKPIAVTGQTRSPFMPDVPTLGESGVSGFGWPQWIGVFAPTGTPQPIMERIAKDVAAVLQDRAVVNRLAEMFTLPGTRTLKDFAKVVEDNAKLQGGMSQRFGIQMGN